MFVCDNFVVKVDGQEKGGVKNEWLQEYVIFLASFILKSDVSNL